MPEPAAPAKRASKPVEKQEEANHTLCAIPFRGERDAELFAMLKASADFNRRGLFDEILFRLDRSFDGSRLVEHLKQHMEG